MNRSCYMHLKFRRSSAVEQLTVNQLVVGSIPTAGAISFNYNDLAVVVKVKWHFFCSFGIVPQVPKFYRRIANPPIE